VTVRAICHIPLLGLCSLMTEPERLSDRLTRNKSAYPSTGTAGDQTYTKVKSIDLVRCAMYVCWPTEI